MTPITFDHVTAPMLFMLRAGRPVLEPLPRAALKSLQTVLKHTVTDRVRYAATKKKPPRHMAPSLALVYRTLVRAGAAGRSTPDLVVALPTLAANTVRWACQVLRQKGLVRSLMP